MKLRPCITKLNSNIPDYPKNTQKKGPLKTPPIKKKLPSLLERIFKGVK